MLWKSTGTMGHKILQPEVLILLAIPQMKGSPLLLPSEMAGSYES